MASRERTFPFYCLRILFHVYNGWIRTFWSQTTSRLEVSFNPSSRSCLLNRVQKIPLNLSHVIHATVVILLCSFFFSPNLRGKETDSVAQAGLELRSACPCLVRSGTKDVHHMLASSLHFYGETDMSSQSNSFIVFDRLKNSREWIRRFCTVT